MDASQIEDRLRTALRGVEGVDAAYLFGSVARGEATERSDVDVAVLLSKDPPPTLPPDLAHRVLRDGRLVLDRDPSARIRFEVHPQAVPVRRSRSAPVTDPELVAKKLTLIETCVRELKTLARPAVDRRIVRDAVEHRLGDLLEFSEALRTWIAAR